MIEFYWPGSNGEWAAFSVAAITIVFGLILLLMPRLSFRMLRLQTAPDRPDAIAEGRGTMAGFYLASGLCCVLFAQPFLYMVLGFGWAATAFGRLVSIVFDRAGSRFNWLSLAFEILLAILPLGYVFGFL